MTTPGSRSEAALRLAFVLWSGAIGGAETLVAALAGVLRASGVDAQVVVLTRAEPLTERLRQAAIPFSELGLGRPRAALRHPRLLAEAVSRSGSDGAILPGSGFLAPTLRLGGYRGRIVAVEHGSVLQPHRLHRRSRLVDRLDRLLGASSVDAHVAVSNFVRGRMQSGSIVTIPNGVDLDLYRPTTSPRSEHPFVIGCVSRLIPGKGVEDVLVAAQPAILRGARLRIAGDGPERSKLEQLAKQLGIHDDVSFEGWIPDAADVAVFWGGCDVAITAPNDWVESFGLGAVEAMACGRAVVATRAGGLAEVVVPGRTGFLAKPGDTDALAAALLAYMGDESLLTAHGVAARILCERRFDIRRSAAGYAGLFQACRDRGIRDGCRPAFQAEKMHKRVESRPACGPGEPERASS